jgi:uncharacterized membrane protein YjgN (DUF898 family)
MTDAEGAAPITAPAEPRTYEFEFRGRGGEYFGIWIVNLALTVITLGIYSAWATVRTRRYFRGNAMLAGHAFDYHASPVRILIGRAIAVLLLVAYNISTAFTQYALLFWFPVFIAVIPWLINSSLRFNARNTSYRNVRFNFTGTYWGAMKAYLLWPMVGILTFGLLIPLARRARDYFYVNHHTYGGRPFATRFDAGTIYGIYILAVLMGIGLALVGSVLAFAAFATIPDPAHLDPARMILFQPLLLAVVIVIELAFISIGVWVATRVFNLVVGNTLLDGRHRLGASLSALQMTYILVTNVILTVVTLGIYYPWAQVRMTRYRLENMRLEALSDLDEFTSETFKTQSAVGEEIAGFFDLDFGL